MKEGDRIEPPCEVMGRILLMVERLELWPTLAHEEQQKSDEETADDPAFYGVGLVFFMEVHPRLLFR
jgi:hypothetical protein